MENTNCMFPLITYEKGQTNYQWGLAHGMQFAKEIKELALIRRALMLNKNPRLESKLDELAMEQFRISNEFAHHIAEEIRGIADGAKLPLIDIIILNNYTDFRDIQLPEEGCSTVHIQTPELTLSGQTWDMHRSAKNYLCLIHVPENENHPSLLILSLVGCVGLYGVSTENQLIGVNNINTANAKAGLIWPLLVRKTLEANGLAEMRKTLLNAPVTSGHNYIISSTEGGEHLEITPTHAQNVGALVNGQTGAIFHTNHCLGSEIKPLEDVNSMSSTTHARWKLLSKKAHNVIDLNSFFSLLTDHEEYPVSICSHFENGAQDPSFTCGGGASDLTSGVHIFWRGCPHQDQDYVEYKFIIEDNQFKQV